MINDGIIMLQEARPNPKLFPKLQRLKVRAVLTHVSAALVLAFVGHVVKQYVGGLWPSWPCTCVFCNID